MIDCTNELATLQRLKQQTEIAIGCLELGQVRQDDKWRADGYADFRIGDFLIIDLKKQRNPEP